MTKTSICFYNMYMSTKTLMGTFLNCLVPISHLNQGKAAQIISSLGHDDVKIIVKNNEPMAAIIPIERYSELIEAEEILKGSSNV